MKKSVILMAGLMAMALAGSAQAATMFAVQNSGGTDQFTVGDTGIVNELGQDFKTNGKVAITLSKAPIPSNTSGTTPTPLTAAFGPFHAATSGAAAANASFLAQHVTTSATNAFVNGIAPSFSFYRVNQNTTSSAYLLPQADNALGFFAFGTINTTVNASASRLNSVRFGAFAEGIWSGTTDPGTGILTINNTPTYFAWSGTTTGGVFVEQMRLSSTGNLGIGSNAPTSKLQVVGLPVEPSPGTPPAGLTSGAFYRTAAGAVMVIP